MIEHHRDAALENGETAGLVDEIGSAQGKGRFLIDRVVVRGEEQGPGGDAAAAQGLEQFQAAHVGHLPVEDQKVGLDAGNGVERQGRIRENLNLVAGLRQVAGKHLAQQFVVVNQYQPVRRLPCHRPPLMAA